MSISPPTKPPRGVKQGKETSGLLMSVIRTLSASETNEQREKERAKLEKEYKKSDARLDELVATHAQEIMEVMKKFEAVSAGVAAWGTRCDGAGARLAACRALLRLRRADLRRLWADARAHHYAYQMLDDIERVAVCEREARELVAGGRVLAAATALRGALDTAAGTLPPVPALATTRERLENKKVEVVDIIVKRLNEAVYRSEPALLSRRLSSRRKVALILSELTKSDEMTDALLQEITPEFEASLMEEDKTFETTVMISLEALGVLNQLKEATEKFKVQIQQKLLEAISAVSQRVASETEGGSDPECDEDGTTSDDIMTESARPLVKLLKILDEEFQASAFRNKRLLQLWRVTLQKYQIPDSCLHTEQHYWSAVQQVLQLLLAEYLDIESVRRLGGVRPPAPAPPALRLSDYFAKKRPQHTRPRLYTLPAASAVSGGTVAKRASLVCAPSPEHLPSALPAIHAICAHADHAGAGESSLRAFLTDYVCTVESVRVGECVRARIDHAAARPAADVTNGDESHRTVFAWCAETWRAVDDALRVARACGQCGGVEVAQSGVSAARLAAVAARSVHARLSPAGFGATRWLADDDIARFLQSLPNWRAACTPRLLRDPQFEKELQQAYEREAEILGSSLGDGTITKKEIISDISTLVDVAILCESMDWLSEKMKSTPSILTGTPVSAGGSLKLTDKFQAEVSAIAKEFADISHKCLLLLHLEVRIQCFYYLGPGAGAAGEAGEAEGAASLARFLLALHDRTAPVLAPHRLDYVVCGLGEMMCRGVVSGRGGREALRHCVAALRARDARSLHAAHAYLRLLAATPEEIIRSVREKGAEFSELEYLNALKVVGERRGLSEAELRPHFDELSAALGHHGVTV